MSPSVLDPDPVSVPETRPLLKTKTFWVNVLGAAVQLTNSGYLNAIDPMYLTALQAALNIAVRLSTRTPSSITGA